MCALGTTPEFPLFFGRGPLQSGVLQQLIQTEFTFPGEQKDWYPAEAIRHAAEEAQDLRYMIPVTQSKGYLVWYEHGFALQHDSCLKTVAKPVYISKSMLVIWARAFSCDMANGSALQEKHSHSALDFPFIWFWLEPKLLDSNDTQNSRLLE